jgi:hypothetical protein
MPTAREIATTAQIRRSGGRPSIGGDAGFATLTSCNIRLNSHGGQKRPHLGWMYYG